MKLSGLLSEAPAIIVARPGGIATTPILARNWSEDVLKPAGKEAGIPAVSFHWFRRGQATIQHFGHPKAGPTCEVYMQQVSADTLAAVAKLEAAMLAATA